jgi:hypothetical protein
VLPTGAAAICAREAVRTDYLYGAIRHIAAAPAEWATVGAAWDLSRLRRYAPRPGEIIGCFQLFNAGAVARPWFDETWQHAGGYDTVFQDCFGGRKAVLPLNVVHLGEERQNWHGRLTRRWCGTVAGGPTEDQIRASRQEWQRRYRNSKPIEAKESRL